MTEVLNGVTWGRLRSFLAVLDTGGVGAAAERLHVTPPAISAAITALEGELGADLLTRSGRGVVVTPAGRRFAEYARTMLGLLEEAAITVRHAARSRLRLGAVATAGETVLPRLMASFVAAHPDVELSLTVSARDELFEMGAHREIDIILAGRPPRGSGLVSRGRRPNSLLLVAAPGVAHDPRTATWLLREPGSGTRETTTRLLQRLGAEPPNLTLGTQGAVIAAARVGLGVTLVPSDAVSRELAVDELVVVPLPGTPLDRAWHLSTAARPTEAARLFLQHVGDPARVGDEAFHLRNRPVG